MAESIDGGPGWIIDGETLRPRITDLATFRGGMVEDPLRDAVEHLWSGRPKQALEQLSACEESMRVRALIADCHRDLGNCAAARAIYDELVEQYSGTAAEAVMRQHRGKVHLTAGDPGRALADFKRAAELRKDQSPALLASSQQAVAVARQTLAVAAHDTVDQHRHE